MYTVATGVAYLWNYLCLSQGVLLHGRGSCDKCGSLALVDILAAGRRMGRGIIKDGSHICNQHLQQRN